MRSTLLSPRGVADVFLQVDRKGASENLNNSFSWTQNTKDLSSSESPSKRTSKLSANKKFTVKREKSDLKKNKKTAVSFGAVKKQHKEKKSGKNSTPAFEDNGNVELLKAALEMARQQLEKVHEQREKDSQEQKERLLKAKLECKQELEAIYQPLISTHVQDEKQQKKRTTETSKIIQYLRDDNSKIRKEIEYYAKEIKKMKESNAQLETANHKAQQAYEELEDHVETMNAVNEKLKSNETIFKETLKKMKGDYRKRTRYHECEVNSIGYYEACLSKIVRNVKDRSRDAKFIEDIYRTAEQGSTHAMDARETNLPKMSEVEQLRLSKGIKSGQKVSWNSMVDEKDPERESEGFYDDSDTDGSNTEDK